MNFKINFIEDNSCVRFQLMQDTILHVIMKRYIRRVENNNLFY